jgi:hypothetical protein
MHTVADLDAVVSSPDTFAYVNRPVFTRNLLTTSQMWRIIIVEIDRIAQVAN